MAPWRKIGYSPRMRRDEALAALRAHEAELRNAGVVALSVFGSVARDDAGAASDVDVLVRLDDAVRRSGFHYFGQLAALGEHLRDILGTTVDVVAEPVRKERLRTAIARDRVVAI
jgi:predicted nucleotidyltransferase